MNARLFADYLRELDRGRVHEDLSVRMQALIQAIAETGGKGSLTLKLEVAPNTKMGGDTVMVTPSITVKSPEPGHPATLYFRDPRQLDIEDSLTPITGGRAQNGD